VFISDTDVWSHIPPQHLWIYDRLIVARRMGYSAGPAGIPVPRADWYVIKPITNLHGMGLGAYREWLTPQDTDKIPPGSFWMQYFRGRHLSVDYQWGQQTLAVEGFRNSNRLDRFSRWCRVPDQILLPEIFHDVARDLEWINLEFIGGLVIEAHARYNDDFANHDSDEIFPQWRDEPTQQPAGTSWYPSAAGDRVGFWIKNK
jgi:hypothetical protein